MKENFNLEEYKRQLVLERFKTIKPESKIMLGGNEEITVKEIIKHIKQGDDFGKKIIKVQMNMLKVLSASV